MAKTIFYRLFGLGKMPEQFKATLNSEGILLFDEGIKASVTYLDFRAPGKRFGWRKDVPKRIVVAAANAPTAICLLTELLERVK